MGKNKEEKKVVSTDEVYDESALFESKDDAIFKSNILHSKEELKEASFSKSDENEAKEHTLTKEDDLDKLLEKEHKLNIREPKFKEEYVKNNVILSVNHLKQYFFFGVGPKRFKLDGKYDVICSGSMLGINYKTISSNSVGYKTDYEMRSFDFEEFLLAKGYSQTQIDSLLLHMQKLEPFTENEFEVFRELFLDFSVLGGMPAVIKAYLESNNFSKALQIQKQLILDYEEDVKKYSTGVKQKKILEVYRSIPAQLAKEFKKFQYTKISTKARSKDYFGCVEWLKDAGVINKCDCLNFPELPLKGNVDNNKFKLYFADTGLLVASLDEEASDELRENKNLGVYKGALFENLVADALVKQGFGLYYFKKDNSTLEEDFFVRTMDELIPVKNIFICESNTPSSKGG